MYAASTVDYLTKTEQSRFYGFPIIKSDINKDVPFLRPPIVAVDTYDPDSVQQDSFSEQMHEEIAEKIL